MLNTKSLKIIVLIFALSLPVIFINSCYQDEGDAVVTIHLERNDLAAMGIKYKEGIIDKILNLFSTRAEAGTTDWNSSILSLTLTATSDSFGEKQFTIPITATSYTTTLPSSSEVTLIITSTTDWEPYIAHTIQKNWGGKITTSLIPGNQDISMKMIPMTFFETIFGSSSKTVKWYGSSSSGVSAVTAYKLYRSKSIDGKYELIGTTNSSTFQFIDTTTASTRYYYRVSCISSFGEGVLSDPGTWY